MRAKSGNQRFSLSRWSRRKLEVAAKPVVSATPAPAPAASPAAAAPPELPPVESLSFDSDFSAFLRPGVDGELKQAALKKLFRDPRFNVMDGLDTYIDDYTKADPIPPDVLADLLQRGFGSASEMDQAPTVAANVIAEKPAAEVKAPEVTPGGSDSGTTPLGPPQSAEPAATTAAPGSPQREQESEQARRLEANGDVSRRGADDQH